MLSDIGITRALCGRSAADSPGLPNTTAASRMLPARVRSPFVMKR